MSHLRILSIFNRYLQYGGEETMVLKMAQTISKAAIVKEYHYSTAEWLEKGKLTAPFRGIQNKEVSLHLRQLQQKHQFDIWLIHNVFPAMSPAVYREAQRLKVPVIHILHNYRFGCLNGLLFRNGTECYACTNGNFLPGIKNKCWKGSFTASLFSACFQTIARKSGILGYTSQFIALSEKQARLLKTIGIPESKTSILPLFVDTFEQPYIKPPKDGNILFVGRLTPEKGLMHVLQAWAKISTQRHLVIVGDGPQKEELQSWVTKHHLSNVLFKGFVPLEEQASLWNSASAFIAPSTWHEPGATTILEALGRGRPVIAFAKGAAIDHLSNPNYGWLMDPNNPDSIFEKLNIVLKTSEEKLCEMGTLARYFIQEQRSPNAWLQAFMKIANRVTHQNNWPS